MLHYKNINEGYLLLPGISQLISTPKTETIQNQNPVTRPLVSYTCLKQIWKQDFRKD